MTQTVKTIEIPNPSLVVLVGISGSGKSSFARKHFLPTQVISSDFCRGLVADNENEQAATKDAFEVLHYIAAKRLAAGRVTVIDATNVQASSRKSLVALARDYHCLPIAIVLNISDSVCLVRNRDRADRDFGARVIHQQASQLRQSLRSLKNEGFRHVHVLSSPEEVDAATLEFRPLWNNQSVETGPFDIIGDVHGCFEELVALLEKLGYAIQMTNTDGFSCTPPEGRKAVFLGDVVDRGPRIADTLRLVMAMVESGAAWCVPGNHDLKLVKFLDGRPVGMDHGLADSAAQLGAEPADFRAQVRAFLFGLTSHYVFDGGRLVVAHAGMKETLQGRASGKVRDFALYGETTGETDEYGLPVRYAWAADYRGSAAVVYGHTPVLTPEWVNKTINIDTGCVFGGALTALRYPEKELVSVPAARVYCEPVRPIAETTATSQRPDDLLDIGDVQGKRVVETRLRGMVTVKEENAAAAIEVISRFAVPPNWLIYLPPTMSPPETSPRGDCLEHPDEVFSHYRSRKITSVVCQEKHMGSRVVVIVCRDLDAARKRFGKTVELQGVCYTRTGRPFFQDPAMEVVLIERVGRAVSASGLWDELEADWLCLDCELMPWSAKAQELIRRQYAAVGASATASLGAALEALAAAGKRGVDLSCNGDESLLHNFERRSMALHRFRDAYGRYCWPVSSLSDFRLAPFHIMAGGGKIHVDKDHRWHMDTLGKLCDAGDGLLFRTRNLAVDLADGDSVQHAVAWWEELTSQGGEGMVVKPLDFIAHGGHGLVQPALKCRGREYLRIIYGPEYAEPENLVRLRERAVHAKRSLALREFALGIEALERFARSEPLYRVHECVFGVLALESEPVDPRL